VRRGRFGQFLGGREQVVRHEGKIRKKREIPKLELAKGIGFARKRFSSSRCG
jgi:hypothetical protein